MPPKPSRSSNSAKGNPKASLPGPRTDRRGGTKLAVKNVPAAFLNKSLQRWLIAAFVIAPLIALCIQLAREPEDVPQAVSLVKPRPLSTLITGSLANPQPTTLEFSLEEINNHLAQVLPPSQKKDGSWSFQNASLRLEPERAHLKTVYLWHGLNLHLRVSYMVSLQSGRLQLRPYTGSFGRVPIGLFWIQKMETAVLRKLLPSVKKEQILLSRLETLRLESGRMLMKVRASAPSPGS